jgi:ABC-type transport system involved in cytochrome c biogenesis ATPase subunit
VKLSLDQKYEFYERSVQNPEIEVDFMRAEFKRFFGRTPVTMREDFCGTGAISCHWVGTHKDALAYGVDLDLEPIGMGKKMHLSKLNAKQQARMHYLNENVLKISGGQRQRIAIVRAFYKNSDIIIMDEPTNSLDKITEKKIILKILENRSNKTIILVTHNEDIIKYADRVIRVE